MFKGQTVKTCPLVGQLGCRETFVTKYKSKLCNIPEQYLIYTEFGIQAYY
jgi:hypothetical protein